MDSIHVRFSKGFRTLRLPPVVQNQGSNIYRIIIIVSTEAAFRPTQPSGTAPCESRVTVFH